MKKINQVITVTFILAVFFTGCQSNNQEYTFFEFEKIDREIKDSLKLNLNDCAEILNNTYVDTFDSDNIISRIKQQRNEDYIKKVLRQHYSDDDFRFKNSLETFKESSLIIRILLSNTIRENNADSDKIVEIKNRLSEIQDSNFFVGEMFDIALFNSMIFEIYESGGLSRAELDRLLIIRYFLVRLNFDSVPSVEK